MKRHRLATICVLTIFVTSLSTMAAAPPYQGKVQTSGSCSPVFVNSTVAQNVTITGCGSDRRELQELARALTRLSKQGTSDKVELEHLIRALNQVLQLRDLLVDVRQASNAQTELLSQVLSALNEGKQVQAVATQVQHVAERKLACSVQIIDSLRVTLTRIDQSHGKITIYFDVVNEGITEVRKSFFGAGSFGNGASTIIVRGRQISATGIDVGGVYWQGLVETFFVPGVKISGRVDFDKVYADISDIDLFQLAYSFRNLRPDGRLAYQPRCE